MRKLLLIALPTAMMGVGCATQPTTSFKQPVGADDYVQAVRALERNDEAAAIDRLKAALARNPSLTMAQMKLGEIYFKRKQFDTAVPYLQAASDLDPYTVENHYNLGVALQVLNRLHEAALAYIRAIKLDPDDFGCNMNLGLVYFALGQLDPAVYYLERSTRIDGTSARAWSNLGVVYDAQGNLVLAEASYRKALELDANSESTLINLTSNLIGQKKSADAVAIARQLIERKDDAMSYKRLGDAFAVGRRWSDAIAAYDSAVAKDATFAAALNAKAELFIAHYETDLRIDDALRKNAMASWKQSLAVRPDQPDIREELARWSDPKVFK